MTQNKKEIEELAKEYARQYYLVSEENHPEENATKALADLVEYHRHQLQKARQEWLFELTEGVMIGSDGNRKCYFIPCERLDRYKSELDKNTNKTP